MGEYRERIAAVQHEIWSHWMRYLFSVCTLDDLGNVTIPVDKVRRWQRQMHTDYANLTDKERESDRNQADKILAERDAEIAALRQQVDAWQATGNAIMLCAVGREAPLSDSDVCGEINALRQRVAELQAWKDAVPVAEIVRYTFDQYDSTTIRPSDDWHKIKDWMDVVSPE